MRKVILDLAVTLDGFIEGPQKEIDWCIMDEEMDFDGFLSQIDAIFYGRVSYEEWGQYRPEGQVDEGEKKFWENIHSKRKYVFTRQESADENVTFIQADIAETVAEIKKQEGKDIWLYGGAGLIRSFIQMGLIDTYRLSVHPVALGGGKPLFEDLRDRLNLRLIDTHIFQSGVVQLIYQPA